MKVTKKDVAFALENAINLDSKKTVRPFPAKSFKETPGSSDGIIRHWFKSADGVQLISVGELSKVPGLWNAKEETTNEAMKLQYSLGKLLPA